MAEQVGLKVETTILTTTGSPFELTPQIARKKMRETGPQCARVAAETAVQEIKGQCP